MISCDLCPRLARQPKAHVILASKDPADVFDHIRLVIPQPRQQRHRLAGHDMLAGKRERLLFRPIGAPTRGVLVRAVVGGDDTVARRPAVLAPQVQPLAMAADRHARHRVGRDACFFQHAADHSAVCFPHLFHIALDKTRARRERLCLCAANPYLAPFEVVKRRLGGRSPIVQAQKVSHVSSPLSNHARRPRLNDPLQKGRRKPAP